MAKVLVVEDEMLVAKHISAALEDVDHEVVGIADSYDAAMEVVKANLPDVVLLDIVLEGDKDGIELAKELRHAHRMPLIYLSANSDDKTLKKAFETHPQAFLTKPFNDKDLHIAVELALQNFDSFGYDINVIEDAVFVRKNERYIKVYFKDILYIEAGGSYCTVFTRQEEHLLSINSQRFLELLNNRIFIRVHRSYIVNVNNIDSFTTEYVSIGDKNVPVTKTYQNDLFQLLRKA